MVGIGRRRSVGTEKSARALRRSGCPQTPSERHPPAEEVAIADICRGAQRVGALVERRVVLRRQLEPVTQLEATRLFERDDSPDWKNTLDRRRSRLEPNFCATESPELVQPLLVAATAAAPAGAPGVS